MKKSKYTDEKAAQMLQQRMGGAALTVVCCEHNISSATFYKWTKIYKERTSETAESLKPIAPEGLKALNDKHGHQSCSTVISRPASKYSLKL